jgi:hypothetical protein
MGVSVRFGSFFGHISLKTRRGAKGLFCLQAFLFVLVKA